MIEKIIIAAINAILTLINGFDYNPEQESYGPCWIGGIWDPEKADQTMRLAQSLVFDLMRQLNMPLNGWNDFDIFVSAYARYKDIRRAYAVAKADLCCMSICGLAAVDWKEADKIRF